MEYIALVTGLALLVYLWISFRVGQARGKYDVAAPATTGNEMFERHYRVQLNTLEQLVVFLPSILLFGTYASATIGAGIGLVFVVGRILYAINYVKDPSTRTVGFMLTFVANVILLLGGIGGAAMALG